MFTPPKTVSKTDTFLPYHFPLQLHIRSTGTKCIRLRIYSRFFGHYVIGNILLYELQRHEMSKQLNKKSHLFHLNEIFPLGALWIFLISIELKASKGRVRRIHGCYYTVTCRSRAGTVKSEETLIARQRFGKHIPAETKQHNNTTAVDSWYTTTFWATQTHSLWNS
jgi:hypothetical protein